MAVEPAEVLSALTQIIAEEAGVEESTITRQTHLADDLDIDSLGLLTVATQVEERFPVTLEDSMLPKVTTVDSLVELVCDSQA